jgi:hypothetical protein
MVFVKKNLKANILASATWGKVQQLGVRHAINRSKRLGRKRLGKDILGGIKYLEISLCISGSLQSQTHASAGLDECSER